MDAPVVLLQAPTGKTVAVEAHPTRPLVAAVEKVRCVLCSDFRVFLTSSERGARVGQELLTVWDYVTGVQVGKFGPNPPKIGAIKAVRFIDLEARFWQIAVLSSCRSHFRNSRCDCFATRAAFCSHSVGSCCRRIRRLAWQGPCCRSKSGMRARMICKRIC